MRLRRPTDPPAVLHRPPGAIRLIRLIPAPLRRKLLLQPSGRRALDAPRASAAIGSDPPPGAPRAPAAASRSQPSRPCTRETIRSASNSRPRLRRCPLGGGSGSASLPRNIAALLLPRLAQELRAAPRECQLLRQLIATEPLQILLVFGLVVGPMPASISSRCSKFRSPPGWRYPAIPRAVDRGIGPGLTKTPASSHNLSAWHWNRCQPTPASCRQ